MFPTAAASMLAVVGTFALIWTIGSVWLSNASNPRMLMSVNYPLGFLALVGVPHFPGSEWVRGCSQ